MLICICAKTAGLIEYCGIFLPVEMDVCRFMGRNGANVCMCVYSYVCVSRTDSSKSLLVLM